MSEKSLKMPSVPVIFLVLIVIGVVIGGVYFLSNNSRPEYDESKIVIVEDSGMLIDFDRDGYTDYVKYIYAEVVYGGEDTNFQTGTGE